jgi:hypothetical protein
MADADSSTNTNETIEVNEPASDSGWKEHAKTLREENKSWRLKLSAAEAKLNAAEADSVKFKTETEDKLTKAQVAANERVIRAELKSEAIKAGMIDLDGLKLADLSVVKLADDGNVSGAEEMLKALKEAKPYLFKQPQSSSGKPGVAPSPDDGKPKLATDMTADEYKKHKAQMGLK